MIQEIAFYLSKTQYSISKDGVDNLDILWRALKYQFCLHFSPFKHPLSLYWYMIIQIMGKINFNIQYMNHIQWCLLKSAFLTGWRKTGMKNKDISKSKNIKTKFYSNPYIWIYVSVSMCRACI